jgi:HSP20 family protein
MPTSTGQRAPLIDAAEYEPDAAEEASYLREERRCGPFSRSLALPAGIDAAKLDARLEDGVLEVTLPLRPGSDTEPIQIRPSQ